MTRDQWLEAIIDKARPMFKEAGKALPDKIRACMGPPHRRMKAIGLCWGASSTTDHAREIWVSSEHDDPIKAAGTLVHELCHSALPPGVAHGKLFKQLGEKLLLTGRAKHMGGENEQFKALWTPILEKIGPMPGGKFHAVPAIGYSKQAIIPQKNVMCPHCEFAAKVRVDQIKLGRLRCPQHKNQMLLFKAERV